MLKGERAKFIVNVLDELYPKTPVPLNNQNNFELLIAVLLSAQCTDVRVNKVTPSLFSIANNPFDMQDVDTETIYKIIRPCGLAPQKSKAISKLSRILVDEFNGEVPDDINALEKLPGVGHKTASVVISQGFGHPAFPVDTHIHRLAQRWGLTKGKNVKVTEKDLKKIFSKDKWNKLHLQIIFYGREFCSAWGCDGTVCKICTTCYPNRKKAFVTNKS
jgi:endonuclease-3|tara:strand:- start:353 stop:1006 length:654 start_codon:yes stop_codon:yes gene_type:complete